MDLKPYEEKAMELLKTHGKELAKDLLLEVAMPAGKAAVDASATKVDDAVWPMFEQAAKKAIEDL